MPRTIYDILSESRVTASASAQPYACAGEPGPSHGFHTEVLIVAVQRDDGEEAVEIHGDARAIRRALVDAIAAIDTMGDHYVLRGELSPDWMSPDPNEGDQEGATAQSGGYDACPCGQWRLDLITRCWEPTKGPASAEGCEEG